MDSAPSVRLGRTAGGYVISIAGPASMRESFALRRFFHNCEAELIRVIDFGDCSIVDSTFAGMLVKWKKELGEEQLVLVADDAKQVELFGAMHLEDYFAFEPQAPMCVGEEVCVDVSISASRHFADHVKDCHDRLAQIEGPQQAIFSKIVGELEKELRG